MVNTIFQCWTYTLRGSYEFRSVSLHQSIIYHSIFLRIGSFVFFMFLLWDHNYSELMEWNFGGEFLLAWKWAKKAQRDPLCPFVHYYSIFFRIGPIFSFIFCMKLRDHKYSKLTEPNFLGKFLLALKWPRTAQFVHLSIATAFSQN